MRNNLNQRAIKQDFPEIEAVNLDHSGRIVFLTTLYQARPTPFSIIRTDDNSEAIKQGVLVANQLTQLGFTKAPEMRAKFQNLGFETLANARIAKETCEAIAFALHQMPPKKRESLMKFISDRDLFCGAGTITNLQEIYKVVTIESKNIFELIALAKREAIENIISPMYRSDIFPSFTFNRGMEIHYIPRLANAVWQEYGLLEFSDHYVAHIDPMIYKELILQAVDTQLNSTSIITGVVSKIMISLEAIRVSSTPESLAQNVGDYLETTFGEGSREDVTYFISQKAETSSLREKVQDRVTDFVTIYLAENLYIKRKNHDHQLLMGALNGGDSAQITNLLKELGIEHRQAEIIAFKSESDEKAKSLKDLVPKDRIHAMRKHRDLLERFIYDVIDAPIRDKFQLVMSEELSDIRARQNMLKNGAIASDLDDKSWLFVIENSLQVRENDDSAPINALVYAVKRNIQIQGKNILPFLRQNNPNSLPIILFENDVEIDRELLTYPEVRKTLLEKNKDDNYPIHLAVKNNNLDMVRAILETPEGQKSLLCRNADRSVPIDLAVKNNNLDIIKAILETPEGRQCCWSSIYIAANTNNLYMVKAILETPEGRQLLLIADGNGCCPIHYAVNNNNLDMVRAMLEAPEWRQSLSKANILSNCPIHIAILHKNTEMVRELLKHPEAIQTLLKKNKHDNYPIHLAVDSNNLDMVRAMLEAPECRQSLSKANILSNCPIHIAIFYKNTEMVRELLKHPEAIQTLLEKDMYGDYPIYSAIKKNNPDMVKAILETPEGRQLLLIADRNGWCPIHYAAHNNNLDIIKAILETPEGQKSLLNTDVKGHYPIQYAIEKGNKGIVGEMLKNPEVVKLLFYTKEANGKRLIDNEIVAECLKKQWALGSNADEPEKVRDLIFQRVKEQAPTSYYTSLARSYTTKWDPNSLVDCRAQQILNDVFSKTKNMRPSVPER